jgi:peptide/nickel transport system permease protein
MGTKSSSELDGLPALRRRRRPNGSLVAGLLIIALVVVSVTLGPFFVPHDPLSQDLHSTLQPPGGGHVLGTDNLGRDLFARILYAGRTDLQIGILATLVGLVLGAIIGAVTGYYGGWVDVLFMRILDATMAFPRMVLVIAIVAMLGPGLSSMYIALVIIGWVIYARLIRGEVLVTKQMEYVLAAQAIGVNDVRMIRTHILPNAMAPALVFAVSNVVLNILFAASLSFLGLGVQPPNPEWGTMIAEARVFMLTSPSLTVYPGLAVVITGLGFTLLGDGLLDHLRPGG